MPYGYHYPSSYTTLKVFIPTLASKSASANASPRTNTPNSKEKASTQTPIGTVKSAARETAQTPIIRQNDGSLTNIPPLPLLMGSSHPRGNSTPPTTSRQNSRDGQSGANSFDMSSDLADSSNAFGMDYDVADDHLGAEPLSRKLIVSGDDETDSCREKEKVAIDLSPKICTNCRKNFYGNLTGFCSGECMHSYNFLQSAFNRLSAVPSAEGEGY